MTTNTSTMTRRRSLMRRGAIGLGGAALVLGAGFAAAPAQAADTGVPVLEQIKSCESGGDYTAVNASSGASGAYQFLDSTWQSLSASAGYSSAASAPESVQDAAALELYNAQGTTPWAASESCWAGASTESTTATADAAATAEDVAAVDQTLTTQSVETTAEVAAAAPDGEVNEQVGATAASGADDVSGAVPAPAAGGPGEFTGGFPGGQDQQFTGGESAAQPAGELAAAAC